MSLTSYSGLVTAVGDWLERTDAAGFVPDWIALTEARMNRDLRVGAMIERDTATISDEFSAVPADFLAPRSMRLVASPYSLLQFLSPEQMAAAKAAQPTGQIWAYALVGNEFEYCPTPVDAQVVVLSYYAKIPPLTSTNTSNWVLASHPDAYLRGCLLEAALFYGDQEMAQTNSALFSAALDTIRAAGRGQMAANLTALPGGYAW